MPSHQNDLVVDQAKTASFTNDTLKKSPILRFGWMVAVAFFIVSLAVYCWHFDGGISSDQSMWGQFGDFMGGLVNPIVGLVTIWLLTVSLNQSHLALSQTAQALNQSEAALKQSAAEIVLAKQALQDNQKIQAATEAALREQAEIARQTRDMNNAIALFSALTERRDIASRNLKNLRETNQPVEEIAKTEKDLKMFNTARGNLGTIMSNEVDRLTELHLPKSAQE